MKIIIEIEARFGSKFREEYAPQSLKAMVTAWVISERGFNKKTKIDYKISEWKQENKK